MKHTWYECLKPCERPGCMFCEGGLGLCTVCHGFEGTLTTDCCGRKLTKDEEHRIYDLGTLDFREGVWVELKPKTPELSRRPKGGRLE